MAIAPNSQLIIALEGDDEDPAGQLAAVAEKTIAAFTHMLEDIKSKARGTKSVVNISFYYPSNFASFNARLGK